jgi:hypothetical protein
MQVAPSARSLKPRFGLPFCSGVCAVLGFHDADLDNQPTPLVGPSFHEIKCTA